jgi:hypothetical protein
MAETLTKDAGYYRELLDQTLRSLPAFPEDRFAGRGIVLCGGGIVYFPCIWICVRMLRSLGCTLPIELWHRGPRELTEEMKALLQPYDVVFRDGFEVAREFPVRRLDGWELKPYAILNSRFAEVLYIDADNVVVRNPEFLFETDLYRQTGSLFWPDVKLIAPNLTNAAWELLEMPFREEVEFESGQMLIDKRRCWGPLHLTLHLNEHSDYYYAVFFGDKDTFHLAWRKLAQDYSIIPYPPGALGDFDVLIQYDADGERLFQHRCNAKWTITKKNRRLHGFVYEEQCLEFLRELQDQWSPGFAELPATAAEQLAFKEIANQSFSSHAGDEVMADCSFQSDSTATWGQESFGWLVEEDKDADPVLIITRDNRRLCYLRKTPQGSWQGYWRFGERPLVELSPQNNSQCWFHASRFTISMSGTLPVTTL